MSAFREGRIVSAFTFRQVGGREGRIVQQLGKVGGRRAAAASGAESIPWTDEVLTL